MRAQIFDTGDIAILRREIVTRARWIILRKTSWRNPSNKGEQRFIGIIIGEEDISGKPADEFDLEKWPDALTREDLGKNFWSVGGKTSGP